MINFEKWSENGEKTTSSKVERQKEFTFQRNLKPIGEWVGEARGKDDRREWLERIQKSSIKEPITIKHRAELFMMQNILQKILLFTITIHSVGKCNQ
jgi:predicted ATP-dependent Lon-type protease